MKTRFSLDLSIACWMSLALVLLMGSTPNLASATPRSQAASMHTYVVKDVPGLQTFVGFWYAHGVGLGIQADGQAHFVARVYTWCAPGVKLPCDSFSENAIISGLDEHLLFSRVASTTAYGSVTVGNVQPVGASATLTLLPGNMALFSTGQGMGQLLCGPQAAVGACGA
ncbi:MAG: hypothetical protein ABI234_16875 [Ktedonobacteraceae bacterium]